MKNNNEVNKIKVMISDRKVTNLEDAINSINEVEDIKQIEKFMTSLKKHLADDKDFINHDQAQQLIDAANERITSLNNGEISNKQTMESIKKDNPNLKDISVFSTSGFYNDCKKDIEYIKYIDEKGNVRILECPNGSTLNDFLINNPTLAQTITSSELFAYFERWINNEVVMKKSNEINETIKPEIQSELATISDYAAKKNIKGNVTFGVDSNDEVLYTLGKDIYKFRDTAYGRELYLVSDFDKTLDYENKDEQTENEMEENIQKSEKEDDIQAVDDTVHLDTEDLVDLDYNDFCSLITTLIQGNNLSDDEQAKLIAYANKAIIDMQDGSISLEEQNAIDNYYMYLQQQKDSNEVLSLEEKQVISSYENTNEKNKEIQATKEAEAKKDGKVKVLELKKDNSGKILTITIIEVTTLFGILAAAIIIALT